MNCVFQLMFLCFMSITPVLNIYAQSEHVRGTKASWEDQKAGGPENLLALRAEGTRVSS